MISFSMASLLLIFNIILKKSIFSLTGILAISITIYTFYLGAINFVSVKKKGILHIEGFSINYIKYKNITEIIIAKNAFSAIKLKEIIVREKDYEIRFTPQKENLKEILNDIKNHSPQIPIIYLNRIVNPLEFKYKK